MKNEELISKAQSLVKPMSLSRDGMDACTVGCALLTKDGNVYTGICFHVSCGIGICAEHAAIAEMLKNGEKEIKVIVATSQSGILSPCGRCRELMIQLDSNNKETKIILKDGSEKTLNELLPDHWLM